MSDRIALILIAVCPCRCDDTETTLRFHFPLPVTGDDPPLAMPTRPYESMLAHPKGIPSLTAASEPCPKLKRE